jgi:glycosyltransferase involved in cell wall biosynthesis
MNDLLDVIFAEEPQVRGDSIPTVGVLMAVYAGDKAAFLSDALASITRNQSRLPDKVVLVQDGPLDLSLEKVIHRWRDDFGSEFLVVACAQNRGLAVALNRGLEELQTTFIARMDADDVALPDRLATQLDFMIANPEVDLVGSSIIEINERSEPTGKTVSYPYDHEGCLAFFGRRNPMAHPTAFFHRRFFDKAGCYPTGPESKTDEDTLLWRSGFRNGCRIANLKEPLLKFRVSAAFYKKRRNGFEYALRHFKNRIAVISELRLNPINYLWACGYFAVNISPPTIKKFLYSLR